MKKIFSRYNQRKQITALVAAIIFVGICATTAWATLSFVKTPDASHQIEGARPNEISPDLKSENQSRAPEPSTLFLFGSGLVGMVVRFVQKSYRRVKRLFDVSASVFALIMLSPLCLIVSILIKATSRGPIFFTQTRVGKDKKLFEMIKFRTMRTDAEKETGPVWAQANDNRVTPIGKFLRKAHIDEIPQFINVLKGEMSIIGPRPERPIFVEKLKTQISDYEKRLEVKPGITGLAQVWHRYDETLEDVKKKIKYDLLYIRKVCLWTDVMII